MQKDKKALFVSYNAATEPLVRSQVLPYISSLSQAGIKFYFLSFEKDLSQGADIARQLKDAGIEWIRLKFHSKPLLLAKLFDIKIGSIIVLWTCLTKKISIVHARGIMGACMAIVPAKLAGAKLIFDMKSSLAEAYRLSGRIKEDDIYYKMLVFLEKVCVANSDTVIVETKTHKTALEKQLAGKKRMPDIVVLPCCVETGRFNIKQDEKSGARSIDGVRLVYLGSLSGWYMIPEMLAFFKELKAGSSEAEMLFLTDDREGRLQAIIKEEKIEGVTVKRVDYKDVPGHLSRADFGILFKWPDERLDSFPIKVAEYLASGLPVIINSGMGDVESMIRDNRAGVVIGSMDKSGHEKAFREMGALLSEGETAQMRCKTLAAKQLSSSFAMAIYRSIYGA